MALCNCTFNCVFSVENPVFVVKLQDVAYNSGENVTLSCQVLSDTTPVVTWFRNEELITDGNRIKTSFTEDSSVYTMTLVSAKPYDAGVYKCIARNKSGRAFTAARVLHGGKNIFFYFSIYKTDARFSYQARNAASVLTFENL